ncbi:hypothetical protein YYE_03303 [Plasmodium vinckei vinckei]|nr:hypothetical protein YYE_03303 [Plasmodium vinckei vinckei]
MASELHKLSYWEKIYTNEKDNYKELNIELEEWFEENCDKIINWIDNNFKENKNISILDIGSGNGLFLHKLYKKGFVNLYGFDFSKTAIDLARSFFEDNDMNNIYVQVLDICNIRTELNLPDSKLARTYDLLNDKGTFDIFFMNNKQTEYFQQVSFFFKVNTLFSITSCNCCKEELLEIVNSFNQNSSKIKLSVIDEILYETITFGGKTGQTITTLIFKYTFVETKHVDKNRLSYSLTSGSNFYRSKPYSNILTRIKNYAFKAIYKTKLLTYVNDINNLNLGKEKNEFYLIALPLSDKFNPFSGTFCHDNIQYSDKASLPIFIYDILISKHIEVPWNFVIEKVDIKKKEIYNKITMPEISMPNNYKNINKLDRIFINVLDFKAKKNFLFLPNYIMKSLQLNCFDVVRLKFVKLETATSVILQPHDKKFFQLDEPKKILEEKLRYYSCLTKNSTICIFHNNFDYYFDVVRIDSEKKKDVEVASIQDADVIFDFVKEKYP